MGDYVSPRFRRCSRVRRSGRGYRQYRVVGCGTAVYSTSTAAVWWIFGVLLQSETEIHLPLPSPERLDVNEEAPCTNNLLRIVVCSRMYVLWIVEPFSQ